MIWENKPLSEVTERDVQQLLDAQTEEHKHLEYKEELYRQNDAGQKDFLVDVCAFANAEGGVILIGIPEVRDSDGKPTGVPDGVKCQGLTLTNPEPVLLAYDSRVISSIEDRLALESRAIKLSNGNYILAIRIPNSLNKPYCVRRSESRYFPVRRDRNIYYMDVTELKESVMKTVSQQERAWPRSISKSCFQGPVMLFAAIPVFWRNFLVDFRDREIVEAMRRFDMTGASSYENCQFSFKGLEHRTSKYESVAQLRRTGLLLYRQQIPNIKFEGKVGFYPTAVDQQLYRFVAQVARVYKSAELGGPYLLGLRLAPNEEIVGLYPPPGIPQGFVKRGKLDGRTHPFPVMYAPDFTDIAQIIRPLCDQLHQAFGEQRSPSFTLDGNWIAR
jgi:hypothetical protein